MFRIFFFLSCIFSYFFSWKIWFFSPNLHQCHLFYLCPICFYLFSPCRWNKLMLLFRQQEWFWNGVSYSENKYKMNEYLNLKVWILYVVVLFWMNLWSVEHFLAILVITFGWVQQQSNSKLTQKWWQKWSRNIQRIKGSFRKEMLLIKSIL